MITTCLIGVSGWADVHYNDVLRECAAGNMDIKAVCVVNQEEETKKCQRLRELGAIIYDDYIQMLADMQGQCELCMIPTGIPLHRPMCTAALSAGMNVLLEKPAAGVIEDVDAMIAAEAKADGFVAIAYQSMFDPGIRQLKQLLCDGIIGDIQEVRCLCLGPRSDTYYARNNWAGKIQLGDTWVLDAPFSNAFSHYINLAVFFAASDPNRSARLRSLSSELYRAHDIESCDASSWSIETFDGPRVRFYSSHCSDSRIPQTFHIIGDRGTVHYEAGSDAFISYSDALGVMHEKTIAIAGAEESIRPIMHENMCRRIRERIAVDMCDLQMARCPVVLSNASFAAAAIHQIPDCYISHPEHNEQIFTVVSGMQEALTTAFEKGEMVSEGDAPWACTPAHIDLENFTEFKGPCSG